MLAGERTAVPKGRCGSVESIRLLRVARRSAHKARTQAANQIHTVVDTAPEPVRAQLRGSRIGAIVENTLGSAAGEVTLGDPSDAAGYTLATLARRWRDLTAEIDCLDRRLDQLVRATAPDLLAVYGVGVDVAGALLVAAGDNPQRMRSEASFAALCGVSPVPASSGRTQRHRLNLGGDRQANSALWRIVFVRLARHQPTRDYAERRTAEGKSRREIIRCLQRYVARELFPLLQHHVNPDKP